MQKSDNILGDISDLGEMYGCAQLIGKSKDIVRKTADKLFNSLLYY